MTTASPKVEAVMVVMGEGSTISNICILHNFTAPRMWGIHSATSSPSHNSLRRPQSSAYLWYMRGLVGNAPVVHLGRGAELLIEARRHLELFRVGSDLSPVCTKGRP